MEGFCDVTRGPRRHYFVKKVFRADKHAQTWRAHECIPTTNIKRIYSRMCTFILSLELYTFSFSSAMCRHYYYYSPSTKNGFEKYKWKRVSITITFRVFVDTITYCVSVYIGVSTIIFNIIMRYLLFRIIFPQFSCAFLISSTTLYPKQQMKRSFWSNARWLAKRDKRYSRELHNLKVCNMFYSVGTFFEPICGRWWGRTLT